SVLRHRADLANDMLTRTRFLGEMARVQEGRLDDLEASYQTYVEILDLDGDSDLAIAELWRIFVDGRHRLEIAERLEPIYLARESWDDLHGLLELKLDELSDPARRSEVMIRLGQLNLDRLARKPEALIWYGRALRLEPDDDQLLDQACEIAADVSLWDDLRTVLVDAAHFAEDEERRITLWRRAADVAKRHLADDIEAERICLLIKELDPEEPTALAMLDDLMQSQQRWSELEPILLQRIEIVADEDERFALLQRLIVLYQQNLDRTKDAISTCQRVLDADPGHRPTLLNLEALHEERAAWNELAEVKRQLADSAPGDRERVAHLTSLAALTEEPIGELRGAVDLWEEVLGVAPGNLDALHNLQRLLEIVEDWDELLLTYERENRVTELSVERQLELARMMGRVATERLDDAYTAQTHWEAARALDASDKETLSALRSIYRESDQNDALAQVLKDQIDSGNYLEDEQV
ncbi:MAG: hypothetical protein VX938_07250, partial [Myxococcota bacterium]|nr:hypothetical protein [Myxococcota bacterium]